MRYTVSQRFFFDAAHTLKRDIEAEGSRRVHGHTYHAEVWLQGERDPVTGMVMDLAELKRVVGDAVIQRFDHADLNADPLFAGGLIPTTENLVRALWELLVPKLGGDRLHRLRLWEDPTFHVEYFGP